MTSRHSGLWLRGLMAVLAAVAICTLAPAALRAQTGSITGTVTDADTGLPLEGVFVAARPVDTAAPHGSGHGGGHGGMHNVDITGPDGTYAIEELEAGAYVVGAFGWGYFPAMADAEVVEGEATVVDFALAPLVFGTLTGTVTDAETGEPIEGAHVFLRPADGPGSRNHGGGGGGHGFPGETGADGVYVIEDVPVGSYLATAVAEDYFPAEAVPVVIVEDETATQDFALAPIVYGAITGVVTDAGTGLPIAGAHVMLMPDDGGKDGGCHGGGHGGHGGHGFHGETGDDGVYLIENVPVGSYLAKARAWGYFSSQSIPVTITEGAATTQDFALVLMTFGNLEGHVTDAVTSVPIEDAEVELQPSGMGATTHGGGGGGCHGEEETDAEGYYFFEEIPATTYTVEVTADGYLPGAATVVVVADTTTVLDFALLPEGGLYGDN